MEIGRSLADDSELAEHRETLRRKRREYLQLRLAQVQHALRWGASRSGGGTGLQDKLVGFAPPPVVPDVSALEALRTALAQRLAAEG